MLPCQFRKFATQLSQRTFDRNVFQLLPKLPMPVLVLNNG